MHCFLGIPGSQIECERIFSVAGIMTGLCRIRLAIKNCSNLILINKNYPKEDAVHRNFYADEEEALLDFEAYLESLDQENDDPSVSNIINANTFD